MSATTKGLSTIQMEKRLKISRTTTNNFIKKAKISMSSSAWQPIIGRVFIDKFVSGGVGVLNQGRNNDSKKKKLILAVKTNDNGGIKRVYFDQLENYSIREICKIFDKHISKSASIKTDRRTGIFENLINIKKQYKCCSFIDNSFYIDFTIYGF